MQAGELLLTNGSKPAKNNELVSRDQTINQSSGMAELAAFELIYMSSKSQLRRLVVVQWLDHLGTIRSKILPWLQFMRMVETGGRFGITYGNLGTLQNDHLTPVCNPVGQVFVQPDPSTLRLMHEQPPSTRQWSGPKWTPTATVMAYMTDGFGKPLELCPRNQLERLINDIWTEHSIKLLVGFEIEITFCAKNLPFPAGPADDKYAPLDSNHAWGTFTDEQYMTAFPLLSQIFEALQAIGINVQQLHSEAGAGQYEVVLPPMPPVQAVDNLIQTRQCVQQVAATRSLRATCHPMPFPGVGTAAHAHLSLSTLR